ncbi:MAG: HD domain-containing protein [Candidatus Bathyarchaeota archaeon]|nr:HD domain-containing protein [Candidatus Termiticorpusculum sp.]
MNNCKLSEDKKLFKDPIYGYIEISSNIVRDIVDTPVFQRLRRIVQTSYSPLYPSSEHNRFAHSIGVYYLGDIVGDVLTNEIKNNCSVKGVDWDTINEVFRLSCLLHDVGHAPFSHTGEKFYLDERAKDSRKILHDELIRLVKSPAFKNDVPLNVNPAAPHEIMSAIVGLSKFSTSYFNEPLKKEMFARCVTGYTFSTKKGEKDYQKNCLLNCYIALLNSKIIDVDRLDYVIRDAFFTGFDTVNIDYTRLLAYVTITGDYKLAYRKGAISVIENFVYAHDSGRKWIQNHPSILYDMYILQNVMSYLDKNFSTKRKKLFSFESLSEEGQELKRKTKISLLCDDDIISLMKTHCLGEILLSNEYFSRKDRRRTLWKNESEYKAFFLDKISGGTVLTNLEDALLNTKTYVQNASYNWVIEDTIIKRIEDEIKETEKKLNEQNVKKTNNKGKSSKNVDNINTRKKSLEKLLTTKQSILKVMKCFQEYAREKNEPCDFIVLDADQFYSGFNNVNFSDIDIVLNDRNNPKKFTDVVNPLSGGDKSRNNVFYIFCKRTATGLEKEEIQTRLMRAFVT